MLDGERHLRAGDVAEAREGRDEGGVAGDEPGAEAGRPERFDSELKITTLAKPPSAANAVSSAPGAGRRHRSPNSTRRRTA